MLFMIEETRTEMRIYARKAKMSGTICIDPMLTDIR